MHVAMVVAKRGTCDRKRVGAVIAQGGRVVSMGFNGAPPGLAHCEENGHGWQPDDLEERGMLLEELYVDEGITDAELVSLAVSKWGCRNATHAEANALAFAAKYGVSTDHAELFVTVAPCDACSRLLIAAGIETVHYLEKYRDPHGVTLLAQAGIMTLHWKPSGRGV